MSFTGTDYGWGGGSASQIPSQVVQTANPAYGLNGTEASAVYQNIQEVAGDLYIASNAQYLNGNWTQTDATKASYALRFRSNGSIVERVTAPSSAPTPIVWTTVFSISTAGNTVVSGSLQAASLSLTAPLPLGSGGTGATTLAGANIAVTNANNNFSVGQTITGTATVNSGVVGDTSLGAGLWRIMPPSGNQLMLQGTNAAAGNIYFNYSSGATGAISGAGLQVYDGGTSNHSTYGATSATVNGPLSVSNQTTTITSGAGAPSATTPSGSIYLRTDGSAGSRLYVSAGGGTWAAVAVV